MNQLILSLLLAVLIISCESPKKGEEQTTESQGNTAGTDQSTSLVKDGINRIKAIPFSLEEELIMPDDYLTAVMSLKTETEDTIRFFDMHGFEELLGKEVMISYQIDTTSKLIVCFDCDSYEGEIELFDIISFPSQVYFEKLKLNRYFPDEYIEPASIYEMENQNGMVSDYYSNNNDIIGDSAKMKSDFYSYGIVEKLYFTLENKDELEALLTKR